jgi:hypothetical protein
MVVMSLCNSRSNCTLMQEQYPGCDASVPNKHKEVDLAGGNAVKLPVIMAHLISSRCSVIFAV